MFSEKLRAAVRANSSFLCVGLDPDPALIPQSDARRFLREVIDATSGLVCAYKPNLAFFEAMGPDGMQLLLDVVRSVPAHIPVIADAKRGDVENTARFYAKALFDVYNFDAATVNAYGGRDAVEPFAEYADRGVFIWCRSSNPGAEDLQDLPLGDGRHLYEAVAASARQWNVRGNVGLVVGATWPEQIARVRELCPDMTLLLPGVGPQAGDLEAAVQAALDTDGGGIILNASRGVLYASSGSDYAAAASKAALDLRDRINRVREAVLAGR